MATAPHHKTRKPTPDRTTPEPDAEQPARRPSGEPKFDPDIDPDRGLDHEPARNADIEHDATARTSDIEHDEPDPRAIAADRANARTSDRVDGRDGVDGSDTIGRDSI